MHNKKITIIGLGLIGGSLAKALKQKIGITNIIGINRNIDSVKQAIEDGTILRGYTEINEDVYDSDIIFICTPVKKTLDYINLLSSKINSNTILTDVGSTKAEIVDYANSLSSNSIFIGGHPMTGTEKSRYTSSNSNLFENAYYILTPSKSSNEYSINLLKSLIEKIGGISFVLDAHLHDTVTACISHVPHIIASSIVSLVQNYETDDSKLRILAAGGFKDITRIASSSPEMWENIVISNSDKIRGILKSFVEILNKFDSYLSNGNSEEILNFLNNAKNFRDSLPDFNKGLIHSFYELVIDIDDKPGIIGEITTLLGINGVNIQNISILNSREFENGCLRMTLSDENSFELSQKLLTNNGYKVCKL